MMGEQQILCGYIKGMVEYVLGRQGGAGLRRNLYTKTFFSFPGGDGQILETFKQEIAQSNLYFRKVTGSN